MRYCTHKFGIPDYSPKKKHLSFFQKLDLFLIFLVVLDILLTWHALSIGYIEYNPIMANAISVLGFSGTAILKLILVGITVILFELFDKFLLNGIILFKAIDQLKKIGEISGKIRPAISLAIRVPTLTMASFIVIGNVITISGV
jgi:hypothetical protein